MKTFIIIICVIFFIGGLYASIKELFTTKIPVAVKNGKVVYSVTGRHWLYNFSYFLLIVIIFSGIFQLFSYYLN